MTDQTLNQRLQLRTRLALVLASVSVLLNAQPEAARFEIDFFEHRGLKIPYRLLKPQGASKKSAYPLVLCLHGAGERGNDGGDLILKHVPMEFAKRQNKYPCYVLAPQCPKEMKWSPYQKELGYYRLSDTASIIQELLVELVKFIAAREAVDSARIYVVGISMGGFGTWELVMRNSSMFAAAVPICGGGDATKAHLLARLPIWVFHGSDDQVIKVEWSRAMVDSLRARGGRARYTEFAFVGHNAWSPAFATEELYEWLFSQKKP